MTNEMSDDLERFLTCESQSKGLAKKGNLQQKSASSKSGEKNSPEINPITVGSHGSSRSCRGGENFSPQ